MLLQREISFTALYTADPRRGKNSANLTRSIDTRPTDFSDMFAWWRTVSVPGQPHPPLLSRSVSLVHDRPRQRSSEPAPGELRIGFGPLLPGHPSPVATTARLRDHSARHVISGHILNGRVEIPIEPAQRCGHIPRVPSLKAFGRRPRCPWIGS